MEGWNEILFLEIMRGLVATEKAREVRKVKNCDLQSYNGVSYLIVLLPGMGMPPFLRRGKMLGSKL